MRRYVIEVDVLRQRPDAPTRDLGRPEVLAPLLLCFLPRATLEQGHHEVERGGRKRVEEELIHQELSPASNARLAASEQPFQEHIPVVGNNGKCSAVRDESDQARIIDVCFVFQNFLADEISSRGQKESSKNLNEKLTKTNTSVHLPLAYTLVRIGFASRAAS